MPYKNEKERFEITMHVWEKFVWQEYRYRHNLCWRLFFKITAVVVILGIIPYIRPDITQDIKLRELILVPPILASVSAAIGLFLMIVELGLFNKIKKRYISLTESISKKLNELELAADNRLQDRKRPITNFFPWFISIILFILFCLSVANVVVLNSYWLEINSPPDSSRIKILSLEELRQEYLKAVKDAEIAEPAEISRDLIPVVAQYPELIWRGRPGQSPLLVATWAYPDQYNENDDLRNTDKEVWVTVVPELKNFCRKLNLSSQRLSLRLEQLLGLPPKNGKTDIVEIWVSPEDLFRPAPDPEITDREAGLDFPKSDKFLTVNEDYVSWFNKLRSESYSLKNGYPWTRLGYTYDWGNPKSEIGLSEFVIKKNAPIEIHSVLNIEAYCN